MMDDYEKLDYLIELHLSGADIEISVDNDIVHIFFGETSDEYIGTSFNDAEYHILPMLFQKLGFKADFV